MWLDEQYSDKLQNIYDIKTLFEALIYFLDWLFEKKIVKRCFRDNFKIFQAINHSSWPVLDPSFFCEFQKTDFLVKTWIFWRWKSWIFFYNLKQNFAHIECHELLRNLKVLYAKSCKFQKILQRNLDYRLAKQ